ncbi:hypothetical protein ABI59_14170 [Acidobacteria bacterium Mor1]|nr:hypothetical protein ABI59_14170 [Acidobacteria bacterium Mor1]
MLNMRKLSLVATLSFCLLPVVAGDLEPSGAPAPTMKPLDRVEPRTPIGSLPFTITSSGSYYVTGVLTGTSGSNGITIDADYVTLDLEGFALVGVAGSLDGIRVTGNREGITIQHGLVRDWGQDGIDAETVNAGTVRDIRAINNGDFGIRLGSTSVTPPQRRSMVLECTATENGGGGVNVGRGSLVYRTIASNNTGDGIVGGADSSYDGCVADFNTGDGIEASGSNSAVRGLTAISNNGAGLRLAGRHLIIGCNLHGNLGGNIVGGSDTQLFHNNAP